MPEEQPGREELKPFPSHSLCRDVLIQLSLPSHRHQETALTFSLFSSCSKGWKASVSRESEWFLFRAGLEPSRLCYNTEGTVQDCSSPCTSTFQALKGLTKTGKPLTTDFAHPVQESSADILVQGPKCFSAAVMEPHHRNFRLN